MNLEIKFKCPECSSESTNPEINSIDGEIYLICNNCSASFNYPGSKQTVKSLEKSEEICPRCGWKKLNENSCTKCGLIFNNWVEPSDFFNNFPNLKTEWELIKNIPVSDESHDNFLEKCFNEGALNDAAIAYRNLKIKNGVDTTRRIRQLTILSQMSMVPVGEKSKKKGTNWIFIFFMVLVAIFFIWILQYKYS
ncbi:MAG: hypothetical protein JXR95_05415 [Deltaproteobacteria bacterium]|nr:hypothetical protein [Deltaproteobacteria bacterium]